MTREEARALLAEGPVSLEFVKVDGTPRPMIATLSDTVLPAYELKEAEERKERKKSGDSLAVWDVDSAGWRSFRWENIRVFDGVDYPNGI